MDLSVSPDLDAYICYGIVLVLGAGTAVGQILKRLGGIEGIWFVPRTWLLFLMYVAVPVGLFWLLDRTGAITDTSFFAAVLVGVGYERIIAGGNETIRAPGQVSQFWTPFLAYADLVERMVRERTARRQRRLVERVVAKIVGHPERFSALEELAKSFAPDPDALGKQLFALDEKADALGKTVVLEQKIRLLYGILLSVPDIYYMMKSKNIIDSWFYWLEAKRIGSLVGTMLAILLIVVVAINVVVRAQPDFRNGMATYYMWRLAKSNATNIDQARARQSLVALMHRLTVKDYTTQQLTALLRRPGLPVERIDQILQVLLESRATAADNPELALSLVPSLRGSSVDARLRINEVLKLLAQSCSTRFDEAQSPWKPNEGDSTTALEERIDRWAAYWGNVCPPPAKH